MTKAKTPYDTVVVSGGFDPVHIGHVRMILAAAEYGDVIVVANSDSWLYRKKGFVFMPWDQRKEILEALKGVVRVEWVDDRDETVCEALRRLKPTYFANGGDRKDDNVPEVAVCEELGIEMVWNVGGGKVESSSDLVNKSRTKNVEPPQPETLPSWDNGNGSQKISEKQIVGMREQLSGRASRCQREGRGFKSRFPLHFQKTN